MKAVDTQLHRLAARQYSLATYAQATALGMTARQVQDRVAAGMLERVHRGVYRLAGATVCAEQEALAACLAVDGRAVASHRSAGALWGFRAVEAAGPEITTLGTACPTLAGVLVHRTDRLDHIDVSRLRRIPVTTPARTLLDLGAVAPVHVVECALENALLRQLVSMSLLNATLARLGRPGRRGAGVLRGLVEERDPAIAPTESVLEDALLRLLRKAGLPEPVPQYEVAGVRLDFAYPTLKLGVEADSRIWHGARADVQRNSDKANLLLMHGWRVLHFTWFDVQHRPEYVVDTVRRALAPAQPPRVSRLKPSA
jgi:very-short-patch-repair endonuclease